MRFLHKVKIQKKGPARRATIVVFSIFFPTALPNLVVVMFGLLPLLLPRAAAAPAPDAQPCHPSHFDAWAATHGSKPLGLLGDGEERSVCLLAPTVLSLAWVGVNASMGRLDTSMLYEVLLPNSSVMPVSLLLINGNKIYALVDGDRSGSRISVPRDTSPDPGVLVWP